MQRQQLDHSALFAATPSPMLVLTPELIIVEANPAYLQVTGRSREELLGQFVFDVFPGNPAYPEFEGVQNLTASLHRVLDTGTKDTMAMQQYDIPVAGQPGVFEERYWCPINAPVVGVDGKVELLIHRVEDVTAYVRQRRRHLPEDDDFHMRIHQMEAELYSRSMELQKLNQELRQAHAREHEVGLALQRAMLPETSLNQHLDVAVRYLPAMGSLNVCGDWYELVELAHDRLAVAVGDVVGHGLSAACVMGQLRSALSAAIRTADGPARALEVLGLYAGSVDGALATTAVQAVIDKGIRTITYSCAGHPPPVLLHSGTTVELLDQATAPPLGATLEPLQSPEASAGYDRGATLVLYTDGLIERRGQDIDVGIDQLAGSLLRHGGLAPEPLADALLDDLGLHDDAADDTALIVIRL